MTDYRCPWCGCGIEDSDWWDGWRGEDDYDAKCPECGRRFSVTIWMEPAFSVNVPSELESCADRCGCWSIDGYCGWDEEYYYHPGVRGSCSVPDCPLGHPMAGGRAAR